MQDYPRVIGLTGHMRAGKDSVAKALWDIAEYHRIGFADALKNLAVRVDPFVGSAAFDGGRAFRLSESLERWDWDKSKENPEVRRFLQELGTGVRNIIGEDAWLGPVRQFIEDFPDERVVVSDVRFPNEAAFISSLGGELWRIERPGFDGDGHVSEQYVDVLAPRRIIPNTGTVADLRGRVESILRYPSSTRIASLEVPPPDVPYESYEDYGDQPEVPINEGNSKALAGSWACLCGHAHHALTRCEFCLMEKLA